MENFRDITGIGVAALSVFLMWKLSANHIEHNTRAIDKLADVISRLEEFLKSK